MKKSKLKEVPVITKEMMTKMRISRKIWNKTLWQLAVEALSNPENYWKTN